MQLTEIQIKELEALIGELPTKYGILFLNFFNKVNQENTPKEELKTEE